MNGNYPKITISEEGEKWLDNGQMWIISIHINTSLFQFPCIISYIPFLLYAKPAGITVYGHFSV